MTLTEQIALAVKENKERWATETPVQDHRPVITDALSGEIEVLLSRAAKAAQQHKESGKLYSRAVALKNQKLRHEYTSEEDVDKLVHDLDALVDTLDEWRMRFCYADLILKKDTKIAFIASKLAGIATKLQQETGNASR